MGIYLPNMEMPKSCWECYFQDCGNCVLNAHKVVDKCIIEDRRDEDCPLVEIPPHGRLIDADVLMKLEVMPSDNWVFRAIEKAPTIIPASGGNEDE